MVKISAFSAIRPVKKLVAKVTTQAYSSYSKKEIGLEIQNNPYSYLNIIGNHQTQKKDKRFHLIRKKIHQFQDNNILKKDKTKKLYIYQQIHKKNRYLGLICAVDLKEYGQGKIKIHEHTILERELLFAQYLEITKIHAEPVLITYDSNENYIKQESMQEKNKVYDFKTKDGVKHIIWEITNQKEINRIKGDFNEINNLYIADGHHRMASSFRCQKNGKCLAYIIPKDQLNIKPFHRAIKINKPLLTKLRDKINLKKKNKPNPLSTKIQCYIKGQWHEIQAPPPSSTNPLSINHLLNHILKPIFLMSFLQLQ